MLRKRISRRRAIGTIGGGVAASVLGPLVSRGADPRSNVVFVLVDDQRYDALGFMTDWLPTPNMDRLAAEGVHFANAFVTNSLCSPSRASYLTGRYPHCHGVRNNTTPWPDDQSTFLDVLHATGHEVGFVGKWHMPDDEPPDLVGQGRIDRMVTFSFAEGQGVYLDCPLIIDGEETSQRGYITDVLTRHALEFLDGVGDRPFCLYLSHKAAHSNFRPADRHRGLLRSAPFPELDESLIPAAATGAGVKLFRLVPEGGATREEDTEEARQRQFRKDIQGYFETLLAVDDSLGQILGWLDDRGVAENTLVIFTSDSGHLWGEHGLVGKRFAFEESMRVPLLVRFPRRIPDGGVVSSELVLNIDAAPTILRATGAPVPDTVQGESYVDLVTNPDVAGRLAFAYRYFRDPPFPHPPIVAVRAKNWKYVAYPDTEIPEELYHLAEDPGETENLAEEPEHQATKQRMLVKLQRLKSRYGC